MRCCWRLSPVGHLSVSNIRRKRQKSGCVPTIAQAGVAVFAGRFPQNRTLPPHSLIVRWDDFRQKRIVECVD